MLGDLCATVGTIIFGAGVALVGQMYNLGGDFAGGMLLWAGVVCGIALEVKYEIPLWIAAIVIGLLFTPQRRLLRTRWFFAGAAALVVLGAPSILWQAAHGWLPCWPR